MSRTFIHTFLARALIIVLSFAIIICTTNIWGSEGKGIISMLIADLAIIGFVSNIFVGGSMTYFASRHRTEQIVLYAYLWAAVVGLAVPVVFHTLIHEVYDLTYLMVLSVLFALFTANINLFIGQQKIRWFNVYSILQQAGHLLFMLFLVFGLQIREVDAYFQSLVLCYALLFVLSSVQLLRKMKFSALSFSGKIIASMFSYGWKSQLSAFMQFLNYRLSFYFLEFFRGMGSVGVFSVGVALSEAIWAVSRSLSLILYAKVVNSEDEKESLKQTRISLKLSFLITLFFILIIFLIPAQVYTLIFGAEFQETKMIFMLLSPGILAIAVSNIIGHYFAGINALGILNVKSLAGLAVTAVASYFMIPRWGVAGACVATTLSYCVSSGILLFKFYRITHFSVRDFVLTRAEWRLVIRKFRRH